MTYLIEIPLAKIRDEISALEGGSEGERQAMFAWGAIAALVWLLDKEAVSPYVSMKAMAPTSEHLQ